MINIRSSIHSDIKTFIIYKIHTFQLIKFQIRQKYAE